MTQVIYPKFVRSATQRSRLLKANPNLANHPEFRLREGRAEDVACLLGLAAVVFVGWLLYREP